MESDSESNSNVRSMLDHAGRMFNDAADQLHTPEKEARNSMSSSSRKMSDAGRSTGKTVSSQQRREAEEFPWSHDVYSLGKASSSRPKSTSVRHTRGFWHLLMTLIVGVLYGVVIASSGCMMVAHVGLMERVVPPHGWERFSKAVDMYRVHVEPVLEEYVVPYAKVAHDEVCTHRVNPYIVRIRDVTVSSFKEVTSAAKKFLADIKEKMRDRVPSSSTLPSPSSSSSSLVALVPSDGKKKPSGSDLLHFIQNKFARIGQNMVFWGRPMRTEDTSPDPIAKFLQQHVIPQSVMSVTPSWVLYSIIQPLAVFLSTAGGLSLAMMVLAVVMKKTEQD